MDAMLLLAAAGLLLGAVLLSTGIERVIRRLGVRPSDPAQRSSGLRDVMARLEEWQRDRSSQRDG